VPPTTHGLNGDCLEGAMGIFFATAFLFFRFYFLFFAEEGEKPKEAPKVYAGRDGDGRCGGLSMIRV
jgi:hypothetical protein